MTAASFGLRCGVLNFTSLECFQFLDVTISISISIVVRGGGFWGGVLWVGGVGGLAVGGGDQIDSLG